MMYRCKLEHKDFDGTQEETAIKHFRGLIKIWRECFTEDAQPTTAYVLHEHLHTALIREGMNPDWIKGWADAHAKRQDVATPTQTKTVELNDEILAFLLEQMAIINPGCEQEALELLGRLNGEDTTHEQE